MKINKYIWIRNRAIRGTAAVMIAGVFGGGCATAKQNEVSSDQAAKLDRRLVKDAILYEPGTEQGATVPEISAPRLHAILVPERVENNRLIERHREWILEGDVTILGIPKKAGAK